VSSLLFSWEKTPLYVNICTWGPQSLSSLRARRDHDPALGTHMIYRLVLFSVTLSDPITIPKDPILDILHRLVYPSSEWR